MGTGHEFLKRIHDALGSFEEAVVKREKRIPLQSKIPLQQEVDRSRERLVKVIVDIVTETRLRESSE